MKIKDKIFFVLSVPSLFYFFLWVLEDVKYFYRSFDFIDDKVVVSGSINNASTLAITLLLFLLFVLFFLGIVLYLLKIKEINIKKKSIFNFCASLVVMAFFVGFISTYTLRTGLINAGYVECKSERKLSSRASSRTYVKNSILCDSNDK